MTATVSETRAHTYARHGGLARVHAWRLLWLALLCSAIAACGGPATEPEEQVRDWVRQAQVAAEAKERRALMRLISPAYADARGNSRDNIGNLLRLYFLRQEKIALITRIEEVTVIGGTAAEVSLTAAMAATNDSAIGFSADAYRFTFELERDGGDWLLIASRWGQLGSDLH
jgi:hypothetical protein